MRRAFGMTGCVVIAAALHVAAAALVVAPSLHPGEAGEAPASALSAGGAEIRALVAEWEAEETPPEPEAEEEVEAEPEPEPEAEPEAEVEPEPETEPEAEPEPVLPVAAPEPKPVLTSSARPTARPDRPRPQPVQQQSAEQPRRERAQPQRQQAATQRAGQGGSARQASTGGSGGISEGRRRDLMGQWGGQIRSCINRRASPPRGIRGGGRVTLALTVGRDGTIRAVSVAGSSGQPSLDHAALTAAQRARRCPAAPSGLDNASYSFQLPIQLTVR